MRGAFAAFVFTAGISAGVGAMTGGRNPGVTCRITEGEKYLRAPVGSGMICAEIERAIAAQVPQARVRADLKVVSPSRLAATLVVNGRALPEHKFSVMDRDLSPEAVQRFARSLANAAADAAKR